MCITKQGKLEEPKKFQVSVWIPNDHKFRDGEYDLSICKIVNGWIDEDDFQLVKECIENDIEDKYLKEEIIIDITLIESGEWEDVFWHKYYKIEKVELIDPEEAEDITNSEEYQKFVEEIAETCSCCFACSECPCDACLAGGCCDNLDCTCYDEE